ncbi:MAG: hypothetical protein ACI4OP_01250 [Candidatus Coprovivens sp.]
MTKEEIEQYIDLDNKIKNRIVQISHALQGIDSSSITAITPHVKQCFSNGAYENLLCLTDEQINKIAEYDKKKKAEDYKRKLKTEKVRQENQKKEIEEKEYEHYLRLKKKFEKE